MISTIRLFIVSVLIVSSASFFFSKKKVVEDPPILLQHKDRKLPSFIEQKYSGESFRCSDGQKILNITYVNDGYCDCSDGSDEPGTSACAGMSVFYCINAGFKTIQIPSSQVDDGVCDCMDGSDEGILIKCPDNCVIAAQRERERIQRMKEVYKEGSKIRVEAENHVLHHLGPKAEVFESNKEAFSQFSAKVQDLKQRHSSMETLLVERFASEKAEAITNAKNLLRLQEVSNEELSSLLVSLFELLSLNKVEVSELLFGRQEAEHEIVADDEYISETSEDNEIEYHPHTVDEVDDSVDSSCELVFGVRDSRLTPFCNGEQPADTAKYFLVEKLLPSRRPFQEVQLILGYLRAGSIHESIVDFVRQNLRSEGQASNCPSTFEQLPRDACELESSLISIYRIFDLTAEDIEPNSDFLREYNDIKSQLQEAEESLQKAEKNLKESEDARLILGDPHVAFHAYRGSQQSVVDGHYTYTLHFLDKVTQSESDRDQSVNLGQFENIVENDRGGYTMKFHEGDYCYNFGARTAHVHFTCGNENKLLSAREPSTCFYEFEAEGPVACSARFAEMNGIHFE